MPVERVSIKNKVAANMSSSIANVLPMLLVGRYMWACLYCLIHWETFLFIPIQHQVVSCTVRGLCLYISSFLISLVIARYSV